MDDSLGQLKSRAKLAKHPTLDISLLSKMLLTVEIQRLNIDQFLDKEIVVKTVDVFRTCLLSHIACLAKLEEAQKELCDLRVKELTTTK